MIDEPLKTLLPQFSQLEKQLNKLTTDGYNIIHSIINSKYDNLLHGHHIMVTLESKYGKRIVISNQKYDGISTVANNYVLDITTTKGDLYSGIMLNSEIIQNKVFIKTLIGGYKKDEVDALLDIIISDYKLIENILLKDKRIDNYPE
jgi:DivIVA domain-containing protein